MRSVKIGNKDTAQDWDLILNSVDIEFPQPKTEYINIPLGNGSIDMTEALTGVVNYQNRKGKIAFTLVISHTEREARLADISAYVHGKRHEIVVPDDPDFYYMGRITIVSLKKEAQYTTFVMSVICDPYRYSKTDTVITKTSGETGGTVQIIIDHVGRSVIPEFENDKEVTFKSGSITQVINAGKSKHTGMLIHEGKNTFEFICESDTNLKLTYRQEVL